MDFSRTHPRNTVSGMAQQARAEATRQKIVASAVELFHNSGFSGTNLNQIIRRAEVTPGAFYYHFVSKEEVAFAIIDEVAQRMSALRTAFVGSPESGLDTVIEMTFQLSVLIGQDPVYWVAAYLEHTVARYSRQGIVDVAARIEMFVEDVARAIQDSDLRDGVTPQGAARTTVTVVYGCLAMNNLIAGLLTARVAECWQMMLPGLVAPAALPHFENALATAVARYGHPGITGA